MKKLAVATAIFFGSMCRGYSVEHCEPPRVDYVTECQQRVDCLNNNYQKIKEQVEERIQLSDKMGSSNLAAFRRTYDREKEYQKEFCRAYLNQQVISWSRRGVGPPSDPAGTRKLIAATCNVKVLGDFLYGLQGGFYCVEE